MDDAFLPGAGESKLLTLLPAEVLHHILQFLPPADLVLRVPCVCSALHAFIKGNRNLFRQVYLDVLDEPTDNTGLNWEQEVRDLVRLETICNRQAAADKRHELDFVHHIVTHLLKNASPSDESVNPSRTHATSRNAALLQRIFRDGTTSEAFLQRSSLFERVRDHHHHSASAAPQSVNADRRAIQQKSAHLHCLHGRPILNAGRLRSHRTYPFACSKVYDMREYTMNSRWGPFLADGSDGVDWEKVEAILVVLSNNVGPRRKVPQIFGEIWDKPFSGSWSDSFKVPPPRDLTSLEARDPYGVTGTWYRIVCFLDYSDFFAFNFPDHDFVAPDAPRPALDVGEATRLIMLRLQVTSIQNPGPDDGQDLPVVHFKGVSRSLDDSFDHNANSNIRAFASKGTVRLTREGEVRWTTFSIFHGVERWRSEGVQIGGVRSARGVVGNWFDRDYDDHGPAGPTAFWKVGTADQVANMEDDLLPNALFLPYAALIDMDAEIDLEADMSYNSDDEDDEDDDDDEMDGEELSELLHDAELPLTDVGVSDLIIVHHQQL
ncbi:F-box domain-containing protein [Fusarium keratoplasticum]|uniref:F-box domain-containing protein n=1 Tax=Fusarium keratoplasticum TaxID=1328300 RepID=A0ACC0RAP4_9HYPO|nr:F-box domain-containing protein [Fusarium keratoplasticum]KAI8679778.1 F-box domain-containing protein [Fusarium keratoplasticum]